jgi:hypothetical protein
VRNTFSSEIIGSPRPTGGAAEAALCVLALTSYFQFRRSVRFAVCAAEFAKLASIIINELRVGINALRVGHVN